MPSSSLLLPRNGARLPFEDGADSARQRSPPLLPRSVVDRPRVWALHGAPVTTKTRCVWPRPETTGFANPLSALESHRNGYPGRSGICIRGKLQVRRAASSSGLHPGSSSNTGDGGRSGGSKHEERATEGLIKMARLHNFLPAVFMVMLGAWTGSGRCTAAVLSHPAVVAVSIVSGAIMAASMLINDYFDFVSGVDGVNRPDKPLVTGEVKPNAVLLASLYMYTAILAAACLMDSLSLRSVIATSAGLTVMYTPLLKRMTAIKNIVVAAIVAASPLAGALAAGAAGSGLRAVTTSCLFAFLGVVYREIIMDINDEEGDRQAGLRTLPVILGKSNALVVAFYALVCAALLGFNSMLSGHGLSQWTARYPVAAPAVCCTAFAGILAPVLLTAVHAYNTGCDKAAVTKAVDVSMPQFALGMLLISICA